MTARARRGWFTKSKANGMRQAIFKGEPGHGPWHINRYRVRAVLQFYRRRMHSVRTGTNWRHSVAHRRRVHYRLAVQSGNSGTRTLGRSRLRAMIPVNECHLWLCEQREQPQLGVGTDRRSKGRVRRFVRPLKASTEPRFWRRIVNQFKDFDRLPLIPFVDDDLSASKWSGSKMTCVPPRVSTVPMAVRDINLDKIDVKGALRKARSKFSLPMSRTHPFVDFWNTST